MKRTIMAMLLAAAGARAGQPVGGPREVTVYITGETALTVLPLARKIAARMFAGIGVQVKWRHGSGVGCPADLQTAMLVRLGSEPAKGLPDDAIAYALPYEGSTVVIVYTRLKWAECDLDLFPRLLAHVLVHEIAHNLQGIVRHSETGIMKPRWMPDDYEAMRRKPLEFEPRDILLIRNGLAKRAQRDNGALPVQARFPAPGRP